MYALMPRHCGGLGMGYACKKPLCIMRIAYVPLPAFAILSMLFHDVGLWLDLSVSSELLDSYLSTYERSYFKVRTYALEVPNQALSAL